MCASPARTPTREIIFWVIKNYFCQLKFELEIYNYYVQI
jgi:hypothetical protein